jgi:alpha-1,3-rhamnosyl/mannosyltransferase
VVPLGYVAQERLAQAYAEAAVLVLLSDYEAFGLPVLEALASATAVVMTAQPAPASVFGGLGGFYSVPPDDVDAAARIVADLLSCPEEVRRRLIDQRASVAQAFDWSVTALRTRDHLLAGWAHRCRNAGGFAPAVSACRA